MARSTAGRTLTLSAVLLSGAAAAIHARVAAPHLAEYGPFGAFFVAAAAAQAVWAVLLAVAPSSRLLLRAGMLGNAGIVAVWAQRVKRGTTLRWRNEDGTAHSVSASNGSFSSQTLAGGARYSRTFGRRGTYVCLCALHPQMKGKIVVR